jgi:hypothetical protein
MLLLAWLVAFLLPSEQTSTQCVDDGAGGAAAQTQAVRGPSGAVAILKVSTSDDHSKNSHLCNAGYQLVFTRVAGGVPVAVDLLTADDDYGRSLSLRLDGFSEDGKRIFGIISESGKRTAAFLFDYDTKTGAVQLVDLKQQFTRIAAASCSQAFAVLGTSETGAIILGLNSASTCPSSGRWMLDRVTGEPRRLPPGAPIRGLFESVAPNP